MTRIWVGEVELGTSLAPSSVSRRLDAADSSARLLVRLHDRLVGFVDVGVACGEVTPGAVWAAVRSQLGAPLLRHLDADGLTMPVQPPVEGIGGTEHCSITPGDQGQDLMSVVVCTRDRPVILAACLARLRELAYDHVEIIVVDNAPSTDETWRCYEQLVGGDSRFRYVCEPTPGLSTARNRGLAEATARFVAFTDDDVKVDRRWLEAIRAAFARDPSSGCVTGLVPPAELDDPSQQFFDRRYSWAAGLEPRVFDLADHRDESALYPYSAGIFGTGANFAVDRELFIRLGGFDEALGAGSPAGGGEDLDAFVRILRAGRSIVYEPSAIVWHVHRAGTRALRRQLFYYGVGLTAFLTKYMVDVRTAGEIVARLPHGARRGVRIWTSAEIGSPAPRMLVVAEVAGMLAGPFAYLRGRLRLRRRRRTDGERVRSLESRV